LRSQYADSIRERKKGAKPGDFDRLGTEFHRWVRVPDNLKRIGLQKSADYVRFVERDFKFYAERPKFDNELDPAQAIAESPPADVVPFAGLSPQEAAKSATLPSGFKMHVFAAEPDVRQPIAFCLDDRGRVWVAEGYTYPRRHGNPPARTPDSNRPPQRETEPNAASRPARSPAADAAGVGRTALPNAGLQPTPEQLKDIFGGADRILIFEDTDGDHHFDKRTVFLENLNLVSGLEIGFGGVWIGAAPYLMFVPISDWDDPKPAGDPRILLDGWNYTVDTHEVLNTFTWGPDGWLYGCHGVFCPSHVGKPAAPESERQWMDAGVWRYHPTRKKYEAVAHGTGLMTITEVRKFLDDHL